MTPSEKATETSRRSTIADVARLAGVDPSLVSRLLNNDPRMKIRPETRERIEDAVRKLAYRPNQAARSLRTARTSTLGMFIPDFANPAYAEIVKGAERAAVSVGSLLVTGSLEGAGDGHRGYLEQIGNGRVDGLIIATDGLASEAELDRLGIPWLFANRAGAGRRRSVILDDDHAVALALEHLVDLGHRSIGMIGGPADNYSAHRRERAFVENVLARSLPIGAGSIERGDFTARGGAEAMSRMLDAPGRPSAVVVGNVASAMGVLFAAHHAGLTVPVDLSVIAIHDLPVAEMLIPPLTAVRMALEGLGERAVHLLIESDRAAEIHEVLREPTDVVVRGSTAPFRD